LTHSLPQPRKAVNDDFEDTPVGAPPKDAGVSLGTKDGSPVPGGAMLAVTDETAAVGKHSLKFVDAPGLAADWHPHLNYTLRVHRGTVNHSFYLRAVPSTSLYMEWRDWRGSPYRVGPNLGLTRDGRLTSLGNPLMPFPADTWVKFDLTAAVGAKSPRTFDLTVTVPGQDPQTFHALPFGSNEFAQLTWFGFSSNGNQKQAFYVDDLRLNPE
jgi:hypothetical protein